MLRRIADASGRSEAAFRLGAAAEPDRVEPAEPLRIWGCLTGHADRRTVTAVARAVAAGRSVPSRP